MTKLLIILLAGLLFEAAGVIVLSKGLKQIGGLKTRGVVEILQIVKSGATNANILLGVFLEAVFFGTLLYLMSQADLSFIWPLTAIGFVLTTLAAKFLLHEEISVVRWGGVILIMAGAALITWSEKMKPRLTVPEAVVQARRPL
ncbi:MAG: EamA family transporter [Verrucomicrobiota bacterium]